VKPPSGYFNNNIVLCTAPTLPRVANLSKRPHLYDVDQMGQEHMWSSHTNPLIDRLTNEIAYEEGYSTAKGHTAYCAIPPLPNLASAKPRKHGLSTKFQWATQVPTEQSAQPSVQILRALDNRGTAHRSLVAFHLPVGKSSANRYSAHCL